MILYLNSNHFIVTWTYTNLPTGYIKSRHPIPSIDRTIRPIPCASAIAETSCVLIVNPEFMKFYAREFARYFGQSARSNKEFTS